VYKLHVEMAPKKKNPKNRDDDDDIKEIDVGAQVKGLQGKDDSDEDGPRKGKAEAKKKGKVAAEKQEEKEPDMGGKKKGKKGKFAADSDSEDEDAGKKKVEAKEPDVGRGKKKKGKFAADSESEDEDAGKKKPEAKEQPKKKGKKGKFAADSESEEEDAGNKKPEANEQPKKKGKKGKFAADSESEDEDAGKKKPEAKEQPKKKGKKGKFAADSDSEDDAPPKKNNQMEEKEAGAGRKKKGKKNAQDDEDFGEKENIPAVQEDKEDNDDQDKRRGKNKKKNVKRKDDDDDIKEIDVDAHVAGIDEGTNDSEEEPERFAPPPKQKGRFVAESDDSEDEESEGKNISVVSASKEDKEPDLGKKKKKKDSVPEVEVKEEEEPAFGKKKKKKDFVEEVDEVKEEVKEEPDMGRKKKDSVPEVKEEEEPAFGKKKKKKDFVEEVEEVKEEVKEEEEPDFGKKKKKKDSVPEVKEEEKQKDSVDEVKEDEEPDFGKKKKKKDFVEEVKEEEEPDFGKKKKKKDFVEEEVEEPDFGKKKKKKDFVEEEEVEEPDFGKKKKKKDKDLVEEEVEEPDFGKKKKKKDKDVVEEVKEEPDFGKKKKNDMQEAPAGGMMVGQIIEMKKVPKKEKYTICQVRIGDNRVVQIVTNAEVRLDMKLAVAVAPCTVPAVGEILARKVQKEDSDGMFLGPNELGWDNSGLPEDVPVCLDKFKIGDAIPSLEEVQGGKKGKKEKKKADDEDLDALLGEFGVNVTEAPAPAVKGKKGKKKDPEPEEDIDALLAEVGVTVTEAPAAKGKKGKKKEEEENEDIDALLGEFGVNVTEAPAPTGKKGKKKAAKPDEDLDAILGEFGVNVTEAEPAKGKKGKKKKDEEEELGVDGETEAKKEEGEEEAKGDDGESGGEDDQNLTAKQKANKKKADKRKAAKAAQKEEPKEEIAPKAKGKAGVAAKLQERMRAMQELEEEKRKHDEEQQRILDEEDRRIAEEEAERERLRKARKDKKDAKLKRMAEEGLLMTKAEKERRAAAAIRREQFEAMGLVAGEQEDRKTVEVVVTEENKKILEASLKKQKTQWVASDTAIEGVEKWSVLEVNKAWTLAKLEIGAELIFVAPKKRTLIDTKKKKAVTKKEGEDDEDDKSKSDAEVADEGIPPSAGDTEEIEEVPAEAKVASDEEDSDDDWDKISTPKQSVKDKEESEDEDDESGSESDSSSSSSSSSDSFPGLRAPICCIMGHVDTGKTKLLDKIRHTNVQEGEAGGITQQIGATFFPKTALEKQSVKVDDKFEVEVPGLLIIDTPGHESFNNLRQRGSSLADIAILVIDIVHGLEPTTVEALELLKKRKCPFVVALNKVDRIEGWGQDGTYNSIQSVLNGKSARTKEIFDDRLKASVLQLNERGLNCALWWENEDLKSAVSIIPTSAWTGEGVPDLLHVILKFSQNLMYNKITRKDELQCTVLDVKNIDGLGTTCDVILVNGELAENDQIVLCGMNGPIVTNIRALLTPEPLKESRVKGDFVRHKKIDTSMGVKIVANNLSEAVAGTSLFVCGPDDDLEELEEEVMEDFQGIIDGFEKQPEGVYVMASTIGSLEALLSFLKSSKIPVFQVNIGVVNKLDVKKAGLMLEKKRPELAVLLAFDVKVNSEARLYADKEGIKIMTADIIYHLFDQFEAYMKEKIESTQKDRKKVAVFPCVLKMLPQFIFNKRDPIVLGVDVVEGSVRIGTPICVPEKGNLQIGRIDSIELNKKPVEIGKKGQSVCIKILPNTAQQHIQLGRHFEATDSLYSHVTRASIDCLKEFFKDQMSKDDWQLIIQMKELFDIS